jgi:glutamate carboxypeptidase
MMFKRLSYIVLFLLCSHAVSAASLPATEEHIRDYVVKNNNSEITMLKTLVNINSGTSNISGVRRVGSIVRQQLNQLGFKTRWVEEPASMKRAATLVAERKGAQGSRILLIGHLDTVFPRDSKFQKFELKKNSAKGPGVIDDKGGVVVLLTALKALKANHALDNTTITVVLTGDEEDSGKPTSTSRKPLFAAAKESDIALDFEPTITLDTVSVARRGIANWEIESHGNESHSATIFIPEVGDGAIFESARILNTMHAQFKSEKYLSFNPGIVLGGNTVVFDKKSSKGNAFGKENVVAKIALARGDFRFISDEQKKSFEDKLTKIINDHLPRTHSTVTFEDGIPAMPPTNNNLKLLEKYSAVSVDLRQGAIKPLDAGVRGAGDISHIAAIVPANLAGLGPLGLGTHSILETIDLSSLPTQTERAAIFIYRLTR